MCFSHVIMVSSKLFANCMHYGNISTFFFSFAYTTSPAAVMKLVVFFRSSIILVSRVIIAVCAWCTVVC